MCVESSLPMYIGCLVGVHDFRRPVWQCILPWVLCRLNLSNVLLNPSDDVTVCVYRCIQIHVSMTHGDICDVGAPYLGQDYPFFPLIDTDGRTLVWPCFSWASSYGVDGLDAHLPHQYVWRSRSPRFHIGSMLPHCPDSAVWDVRCSTRHLVSPSMLPCLHFLSVSRDVLVCLRQHRTCTLLMPDGRFCSSFPYFFFGRNSRAACLPACLPASLPPSAVDLLQESRAPLSLLRFLYSKTVQFSMNSFLHSIDLLGRYLVLWESLNVSTFLHCVNVWPWSWTMEDLLFLPISSIFLYKDKPFLPPLFLSKFGALYPSASFHIYISLPAISVFPLFVNDIIGLNNTVSLSYRSLVSWTFVKVS